MGTDYFLFNLFSCDTSFLENRPVIKQEIVKDAENIRNEEFQAGHNSDVQGINQNKNMARYVHGKILGSGVLSGKMLIVRINENNEINAYFRAG